MRTRIVRGELMDAPDAPRDQLAGALMYLETVNRFTGGHHALITRLDRWSRAWDPEQTITLLDLGTGSGDTPRAASNWAARRGLRLHATGVDIHTSTLDIARTRDRANVVTLIEADVRDYLDSLPPRSFDVVHAALFLHHLHTDDVKRVLRGMARVARRGVVWSDLHRSVFQRELVRLATFGQGVMVKHDAVASVEAGFTKREAIVMAHESGLDFCMYSRWPAWYRFVISGCRDATA